jgi:hypothetical protein
MLANASHLQTFDRICGSLGIDGSGEDRIVSCLAAVSQLENVHVDAYPYQNKRHAAPVIHLLPSMRPHREFSVVFVSML